MDAFLTTIPKIGCFDLRKLIKYNRGREATYEHSYLCVVDTGVYQ